MTESDEIEVVPTSCDDWSLNIDGNTKKRFWWSGSYSISVWEADLNLTKDVPSITDTDVWEGFLRLQIACVYKLCPICSHPEGNEDLKLCCYCGSTVHIKCSAEASEDQIAYKAANAKFKKFMRVCLKCDGLKYTPREFVRQKDNARRCALRALTLQKELPDTLYQEIKQIVKFAESDPDSPKLLEQLQTVICNFFQSRASLSFLKKGIIASKAGGIGVIATKDIPAFTIIGVYPGYPDPLSGEQAKLGRPSPKYALMELNCADFYNDVFPEFQKTFTPFCNEPGESEYSNCAWIQEPHRVDGRLSIITVKDIKKDDEVMIGYGPVYPRDYPHRYEAYAFHPVEEHTDPPCYALWYWPTRDEQDAKFLNYVAYNVDEDRYMYWETADEQEQKNS